jgi:hypothetical protein
MDSILKKIQNNNKLNLWLKLIRIKEKKWHPNTLAWKKALMGIFI